MAITLIRMKLLPLLGLGLTYWLVATLCILLSRQPGSIAALWFPNALVVAALAFRPYSAWPAPLLAFALANALANVQFNDSWVSAIAFVPPNLVEILLAGYFLRRTGFAQCFDQTPVAMLKLFWVGTLVPPMAGAAIGALLLSHAGVATFVDVWPTWYAGSVIGATAVLPLACWLEREGWHAFKSQVRWVQTIPFLAFALLTVFLSISYLPYPFVFLLLPLLFGALHFNTLQLLVAVVTVAAGAGVAIALNFFDFPLALKQGWKVVFIYLPLLMVFLPILVLIGDINQSRSREAARQISDSRLRHALSYAGTGFVIIDFQGRLLEVNDRYCEMLGFLPEELIGKFYIERTVQDDIQPTFAGLKKLLAGECDHFEIEQRFVHKDGHTVWARIRGSVLPSVDKPGEVFIQADDITAARAGRARIEALSIRLGLATRSAALGVWELNLNEHDLMWDERMYALYGIAPSADRLSFEHWVRCIDGEDAANAEARLLAAVNNGEYADQFRIVWPSGERRILRGRGRVQYDHAGKAVALVGVNWDVTDEVEARHALENARNELQTLIDHLPAMVGYWDKNLRNRFGNHSYLEWFGMTPAQMRGKHIRDVIGEEKYALNKPFLERALAGEVQMFEREIIDQQQRRRYTLASYVPDRRGNDVLGFYAFVTDITPLKEAQTARAEAEARLQYVINAAQEFSIVATDLNGNINLFSPGAELMLGYRAEEMVGRQMQPLLHLQGEMLCREQELEAQTGVSIGMFEALVHRARAGKAETREWTYLRKDGSSIPVSLTISPIRDAQACLVGFLAIARDIRAEKRYERELQNLNHTLTKQYQVAQHAREDFEALFANAPGAMLVVNSNGSIVRANAVAHNVFGYDEPELLGQRVERLVPEALKNVHERHREQFTRNAFHARRNGERTFSARRKNGATFIAEINLSPLQLDDDACVIAAVWDVTAQQELHDALLVAKENAEKASKAKSDFVANMSHEIRTPMNAVLGMSQLLERTTLTDEQRKFLGMIRAAGQNLMTIINDILDFSKIEAGHVQLHEVSFDLYGMLDGLAAIMSGKVGPKGLELAVGIDSAVPVNLVGDSTRLQQVLVNLVGNALKFTEQGEVVVFVRVVSREEHSVQLCFDICDTGIGMSPAEIERLFQPFQQGDASTTRRFGGTGLGLYISFRLIKLMNGSINVESEPGKGSTFRVTVPLRVDVQQRKPELPAALNELRFLVVEDNPNSLACLISHMNNCRLSFESVSSLTAAEACVQRLRTEGKFPDVLLIDRSLPDLPDEETFRQFKINCLPEAALILLMLGTHELDEVNAWQDDLVFDRLFKPVTRSALLISLKNILQFKNRNAAVVSEVPAGVSTEKHFKGKRLLLVEDNGLNQIVAKGLLEPLGFVITIANHGQAAVDILKADTQGFDLILMDVQMPVMDGWEATRYIRNELQLTTPIVAMSAGVTVAERLRCQDVGMNGFVGKPIDIAKLTDEIRALLPLELSTDEDGKLFGFANIMNFVKANPLFRQNIESSFKRTVIEGQKILDQAASDFQNGNNESAAHVFHTLSGAAWAFGMTDWITGCREMEQLIKRGDTLNFETKLKCVREQYDLILQQMRTCLIEIEQQAPVVSLSDSLNADPIRELLSLVKEQNFKAISEYQRLRNGVKSRIPSEDAPRLDHAFATLDFATAEAMLCELLERWNRTPNDD